MATTMETTDLKHNLILKNREVMELDGITDVTSFDEQRIIIRTLMGILTVKGTTLQITLLDTANGKLAIEGHINSIDYSDKDKQKRSKLFKNLFK
jgi:sporulation protein YabP